MDDNVSYKWTWAAIVAAVLLVVPGMIVGGSAALLYEWFLNVTLGDSYWFAATSWIKRFMLLWFPSLLHGVIAGALAIWGAKRMFASANLVAVSFSAAAVWIAIGAFLGMMGIAVAGAHEDLLSLLAQIVGIALGLFAVHLDNR